VPFGRDNQGFLQVVIELKSIGDPRNVVSNLCRVFFDGWRLIRSNALGIISFQSPTLDQQYKVVCRPVESVLSRHFSGVIRETTMRFSCANSSLHCSEKCIRLIWSFPASMSTDNQHVFL
jgi:hypothetical protein